ncbi:MAG TPA: adenylate/guanylate cyclase domain-containing protein [Burkholderiales bacterium]|nr:adenylate/guanylate cyclase domain-containing protein [Burkholderiales bacterium]
MQIEADVSPKSTTLPTGTVTFLFTDIEGSTKLWESNPDGMRVALARHDMLLREWIGEHDGYIFKTGGDAFYAVFPRPEDALAAAVDAQLSLAAEQWPDGATIKVRMALNTGEAELRDSDYFGPALNRVARVLNLGHGGQTLITRRTHEACQAMPEDVTLKLLGEYSLKDLPEPQPIYQLCHPELRSIFRPLRVSQAQTDETVPSIAVLPFNNTSKDEENEYFADGLSEELLNVLSKIRGLRVASRTSAFAFKGKEFDIPTVAQKLGVNHVLEGSVRKAGNRVRISAQLIHALTDKQLWSETYNRELDDIFAVQDDIAQSVVQELRERLLGPVADAKAEAAKVIAEVQQASKGRSDNPEAHRLYMQGQFFRDQLNQDALQHAVTCYESALALDPDYALAWAGLSRVYSDRAGQNWVPRREGFEKARAAAQKAIASEPTLPEAHTALGWVLWIYDWDWRGAEACFQRALELAPGSSLALNGAATLTGNLGRLEEAIGLFRRAVGLDPLNVGMNRNLGLYSLSAGAIQEAEAALNHTLQISQHTAMTYTWRAMVRLEQGRLDEALADAEKEVTEIFRLVATAVVRFARGEREASDAIVAELIAKHGADSPYQVAEVYGARNEADAAFEWLERTYAEHDPGLSYMKMDPFLKALRDDPRWKPLLQRMKLDD